MGIRGLPALGIGDTLRGALTADPVEESDAGQPSLRAVGLRRDGPELIACPTCGRTQIDLIPLARQVERLLEEVDKPITVAVVGLGGQRPGEANPGRGGHGRRPGGGGPVPPGGAGGRGDYAGGGGRVPGRGGGRAGGEGGGVAAGAIAAGGRYLAGKGGDICPGRIFSITGERKKTRGGDPF